MTPDFKDPAARILWDQYFAEADRLIILAGLDGNNLRDELRAHVMEGMASLAEGSECDRLEISLMRLGDPLDYLPAANRVSVLRRAVSHTLPAVLRRSIGTVARIAAFGLAALLLAMSVLKPVWSRHVGLFRLPDGAISAGILARTDNAQDLIGWWSIPATGILALGLCGVLAISRKAPLSCQALPRA